MIFTDFAKAVSQMLDPRFRGVLWRGIGLTIAVFIAIYVIFFQFIGWIDPSTWNLPFIGPTAFVGGLVSWGGLLVMVVLSIFLMIPVASIVTSLFLENVADAVEERHYPHLAPAPRVSFSEALRDTLNFFGVMVAVNLVGLLILPFFWFIAPFIFYLVNGWLLGREYFTVAALRREGREGANALRKRHRGAIWFAGILMAIPLTIPVMNLLIPILGAATFTHFYHRVASR